MFHLLIAEAEIELIPPEIKNHPQVRAHSRARKKSADRILLDSNLHFRALRHLPEGVRRGRPDITHITLLNLLESPLNKIGKLRVAVHTRGNYLIRVSSNIRLPRAYHRFKGLIESLFERRIIISGNDVLLSLHRGEPADYFNVVKPEYAVLLTSMGKPVKPWTLASKLSQYKKPLLILGGFPRGDFRSDYSFVHERVSIFPKPLSAWAVASEVVSNLYREVEP